MDQPPVVFAGNGIKVAFAQKSQVIGVFQLRNARWIRIKFPVVKPDSPLVLLAPLDCLFLFIALDVLGHNGRGNRQSKCKQEDQDQHTNQQVPVFVVSRGCRAHTQPDKWHAQHCIGPGQIQRAPHVVILRALGRTACESRAKHTHDYFFPAVISFSTSSVVCGRSAIKSTSFPCGSA